MHKHICVPIYRDIHTQAYKHAHTPIDIHTHRHKCTHACAHTERDIYPHVHTQIHTHPFTHREIYTHMYTHIPVHTETYTHAHTQIETCTYMYTHIKKRKRKNFRQLLHSSYFYFDITSPTLICDVSYLPWAPLNSENMNLILQPLVVKGGAVGIQELSLYSV